MTRYPLTWPAGWKRTGRREVARFGRRGSTVALQRLTIGEGLRRLLAELGRLAGARDVIISTNVPVRLDGLPYASASEPADPGVAVYFKLRGADRVLACDRYRRVADNLAAVAAHIEALRAIDRYGVGTVDQAFAGYTALPPVADHDWAVVLGVPVDASVEAVLARYRELARSAHPDQGGSHEAMTRLNRAREAALLALKQGA